MKRVDIKTGFICNNNCLFCVQADRKCRGNRPLTAIKKDIRDSRKRCEEIVLTGGEVTIRKDFFELLRYAKDNSYSSIQVQTNGRMFSSPDFCRMAMKAGATEFSPALHGCSAKQHDSLTRSPGSFRQTVQGIRNLKKLGAKVITNTVIVRQNYRDLPKIARLLVSLGADQYQLAFVHPMGNAMMNFRKVVPKIPVAAPYIRKGLQIGIDAGIKVMTEAMPLCLMKGYEEYCAESAMPQTEIRGSRFDTDDFISQRKELGKKKFLQCRLCRHNLVCEGPWKEYPEQYGDSEFQPVKKVNKYGIR